MVKPTIELPISKKPTDAELKKLKEYFKEMPVEEILTGLKFAKNRWAAKDAGTLKVGRKSIIQKEVPDSLKHQIVEKKSDILL